MAGGATQGDPRHDEHERRVDSEYARARMASILPLPERLAVWAADVAARLNGRSVCRGPLTWLRNNLIKPTQGALSKVSKASEARRLVGRLDLCFTPKPGSWLYLAENERSIMRRQCPCRR